MNRMFCLVIISLCMLANGCATSHQKAPATKADLPEVKVQKEVKKVDLSEVDVQTEINNLYKQKKYSEALIAILKADPERLKLPEVRKLLWKINDRLVTVQWYLQKSIISLKKGQKEPALFHVNNALDLYPAHEPSLLMKAALTSIELEEPPHEDSNVKKKAVSETDPPPTRQECILADYYYTTGNTYFEQGRFSMAKDSWRQGLDVVPSHNQLQKALGSLLANEGLQAFGKKDLEGAIASWEEAIKVDPGNEVIQEYLDKAISAQEKARSIQ